MRLYSGSSNNFITDTIQNQIADKLAASFFDYYRYQPSPNEKRSWQNSLRSLVNILQYGNHKDHGVILEYQLPLTSFRLDCLICGKDSSNKDNAVIIELKQWDGCTDSECDEEVITYVGKGMREVLHPSVQVSRYKTYLADVQTVFYEGDNPVSLSSCAYLHNYTLSENDPLINKKFTEVITSNPLFTSTDSDEFSQYLGSKLSNGGGLDVLSRIENSKYRPSKKLMEHVSGLIQGESIFTLLDDQKVIYDKVISIVKKGFHHNKKHVIIVEGGPGTGKSVIALNLVADLLKQNYVAIHATGSNSFTETLRYILGSKAKSFLKYFNNFTPAQANPNDIDVLICDEAHRIRVSSNSMFTKAENKSDLLQIQEIIRASKVSVFFVDNKQIVRPGEIGSTDFIKEHAAANKAICHEYKLETQFRCAGSESFINWVDNTLEVSKTPNIIWNEKEPFEFRIFPSAETLEKAIIERYEDGNSARMTAGFCWKWSDPTSEGLLENDVQIGTFKRPWNAKPKALRKANKNVKLKNIPESPIWAYDPNGVHQIGCIYTAQGFEFDYVGVIVGNDLKYRFNEGWIGHKEESQDTTVRRAKTDFLALIKNTYRVLMTRGMKGCYVYFMDKETEKFFRSRIESN
jgi:hypothetical protein